MEAAPNLKSRLRISSSGPGFLNSGSLNSGPDLMSQAPGPEIHVPTREIQASDPEVQDPGLEI